MANRVKQAKRVKRAAKAKRRKSVPRVKRVVLRNGLTVVSERLPGFKTLSIGIWVKAGTRHEAPREAGISHFLEHMVFKGTQKRTAMEITRDVERVGGEFNAFTTREYTCFHITLLARDLELGMDILSDILMGSLFDAVELERERKVILQEIAMVEESPEEMAQDLYYELLYGKHGLGRSILGSLNSVRKMRRTDVIRYFRKHYRPDNMVVSIAGDVSPARVLKSLGPLAKRNWPDRPKRPLSRREEGFEAAPKIREALWWIKRPTEQAHIVWGVEAPKFTSRDHAALILIAAYLGGGMSSHLFQEIREKHGLAYTIYSSLNAFFDSGNFHVYVGAPVSQVATCLRIIEEAAIRLCTQKIDAQELAEVKESMKGTMLLSSDSAESVMQANAVDEIYYGESQSIELMCSELEEVTATEIRRVAKKVFGPGKRSILVYGPRPSPTLRKKIKPEFPKRYHSKRKA
jgi:predicted Zn-dependent peptidase